jgi:hypothetical protein
MSEKNFYLCQVTLSGPPLSVFHNFITYSIATSADEAIKDASKKAETLLEPGWSIANVWAGAIQNDLLEQAAIEVLGWSKPESSQ